MNQNHEISGQLQKIGVCVFVQYAGTCTSTQGPAHTVEYLLSWYECPLWYEWLTRYCMNATLCKPCAMWSYLSCDCDVRWLSCEAMCACEATCHVIAHSPCAATGHVKAPAACVHLHLQIPISWRDQRMMLKWFAHCHSWGHPFTRRSESAGRSEFMRIFTFRCVYIHMSLCLNV